MWKTSNNNNCFHNPSTKPSLLPSVRPSKEPSLLPSDEPSSTPSECVDEEGWFVGGNSSFAGLFCRSLYKGREGWCAAILSEQNSTNIGKSVQEACCFCGGSTFKSTVPSLLPTGSPSMSYIPTIEPIPSSQPSDCENEPDWHFFSIDNNILGCDNIISNDEEDMCARFSDIDYDGKTVMEACCICGGGKHQSRQPSDGPSLSQTPSSAPSTSAKPSKNPSAEPSFQPSESAVPSSFPSVTEGSVLDLRPCKHNGECKSQICLEQGNICAPGVSNFKHSCLL